MSIPKLLRDPIVHFVLIGLALVSGHQLWAAYQGEQGRTITVSAAEMDRLAMIWANTAGRLPTGQDRQDIIDQYVQEEVLVREAQRLGLGEDDTIIRRRLAQKMDFLVGSESAAPVPSDEDLKAWFTQQGDRFAAPERRSFIHIYFSPEKHGRAIETAALQARSRLATGADWKSLGDPFIQKRSYAAIPESEVTRLFGPDFARALFTLETAQWSAPIGSAYGLHLVRVETIDAAATAQFEPIRAQVLAAWQEDQSAKAKQDAIARLVRGYEVIVEPAE